MAQVSILLPSAKRVIYLRKQPSFMGGGTFCLKACDPAGPNAAHFCEHIFDRIGCQYNAPAAYRDGVFESCLGENQDFPGIYTDAAGAVQTYTQPPESLGPITTIPYSARVPASSSCSTYESASLFANAPAATVTPAGSAPTSTAGGSGARTGSSGSTTRSSSGNGNVNANSHNSTSPNGASANAALSLTGLVGAAFVAVLAL